MPVNNRTSSQRFGDFLIQSWFKLFETILATLLLLYTGKVAPYRTLLDGFGLAQ
jgi:hypothetical protein